MSIEQFKALLYTICSGLVGEICEQQQISAVEAIEKLYSSKLYSLLEKEETKVWYYSRKMLYALLVEEEETGEISFPDV